MWAWNPFYNSSIIPNPYVVVGGYNSIDMSQPGAIQINYETFLNGKISFVNQ
jgi:hypothetical protein